MLDRQLKALEDAFLKNGGLRERMTRARMQARDMQREAKYIFIYFISSVPTFEKLLDKIS